MTDHYEMPHRRADECPHAGVGKACRPCRDRFERTPITPDERAAMRALADAATEGPWEASGSCVGTRWTGASDWSGPIDDRELVATASPVDAAFIAAARTAVPRLLDALDTAEAEVARLREAAAPVRPDRETITRALRDAGPVEVVAVHEGYGAEEVIHAHLRPVVDAVLDAWPGESRATVQAEALRDAADWLADMDDGRDTGQHRAGRDIIARLRDRADRLAPNGAHRG